MTRVRIQVLTVALLSAAVASGCGQECDVADECAKREGGSRGEAYNGSLQHLCGESGSEGTFFNADGSSTTLVSWLVDDQICKCDVNEQTATLSGCEVEAIDQRDILCVWEEASCLPGLCTGCTAGGLGPCPPGPNAYSPQCSQDAVSDCESRGHSAVSVDQENRLQVYRRNVRIKHGIATCEALRNGAEATGEDIVCAGDCP